MAQLGSDLSNGIVIDAHGTLYCAGYADEAVWIEHSIDQGITQATWISGGTRRQIVEAPPGTAPGLEALSTGELVAAVAIDDVLTVWISRDAGETWEGLGTV